MTKSVFIVAMSTLFLLCSCAPIDDEQKIEAILTVNTHLQTCYESTLAENGTRVFAKLSRADALAAMGATMRALDARVEDEDTSLGYLLAVAPAPRPLSDSDWQAALEKDLPHLRKIVAGVVGFRGNWVEFEPEGLNVILRAVLLDSGTGTEISLTMRFDETAPPKKGYPRRSYPPCEATRIGLEKIWTTFEHELDATSV